MDDHVACIDQHPVGMGQAFDASASVAFLLELSEKLIGHGAHMALRAPRGHDHLVADRRLALQIDAHDVLRLGIVEGVEAETGDEFFTLLVRHLAMALGYAALLVLSAPRLLRWVPGQMLEAAGRMAFSNYLGTSLVMAALCYGWGLGLFGQFGAAQRWTLVLLVWALILSWSQPWLARYRQGPLEWLWRTGQLAITRREGFQKVYDLTHRVIPDRLEVATFLASLAVAGIVLAVGAWVYWPIVRDLVEGRPAHAGVLVDVLDDPLVHEQHLRVAGGRETGGSFCGISRTAQCKARETASAAATVASGR